MLTMRKNNLCPDVLSVTMEVILKIQIMVLVRRDPHVGDEICFGLAELCRTNVTLSSFLNSLLL